MFPKPGRHLTSRAVSVGQYTNTVEPPREQPPPPINDHMSFAFYNRFSTVYAV